MDLRFVGILEQTSSRDVLNCMIKANSGVKAYKSVLAKAAGCHLSYLSLVLTGKNLLSAEHVAALCKFWAFGDLETDFFVTLVNMEKAGTALLTAKYKRDLERIRKASTEIFVGVGNNKSVTLSQENALLYSSAWYFPALHLALCLSGEHTTAALSARYRLHASLVKTTLETLKMMQLVTEDGETWLYNQAAVLPNAERQIYRNFHRDVRIKAADEYILTPRPDHLFYTSYIAISRRDKIWVTAKLKDCLKEINIHLDEAKDPEEEITFFCMDFFAL